MEVTSLTKRLVSSIEEKQLVEKLQAAERGEEKAAAERQQEWVRSVSCAPFNFLSLEIPPW